MSDTIPKGLLDQASGKGEGREETNRLCPNRV